MAGLTANGLLYGEGDGGSQHVKHQQAVRCAVCGEQAVVGAPYMGRSTILQDWLCPGCGASGVVSTRGELAAVKSSHQPRLPFELVRKRRL